MVRENVEGWCRLGKGVLTSGSSQPSLLAKMPFAVSLVLCIAFSLYPWSSLVEWDEGSYQPYSQFFSYNPLWTISLILWTQLLTTDMCLHLFLLKTSIPLFLLKTSIPLSLSLLVSLSSSGYSHFPCYQYHLKTFKALLQHIFGLLFADDWIQPGDLWSMWPDG